MKTSKMTDEEFIAFVKRVAEEVRTWPRWKREVLSHVRRDYSEQKEENQ